MAYESPLQRASISAHLLRATAGSATDPASTTGAGTVDAGEESGAATSGALKEGGGGGGGHSSLSHEALKIKMFPAAAINSEFVESAVQIELKARTQA